MLPFQQIRCHRCLRQHLRFHSHKDPNTLRLSLDDYHQRCFHLILCHVLNAFEANNLEPVKLKNLFIRESHTKFVQLSIKKRQIAYLFAFRIFEWTQSNVAFVVNGCRIGEFVSWKWNGCFSSVAGIFKLSHNFSIQWTSAMELTTQNLIIRNYFGQEISINFKFSRFW